MKHNAPLYNALKKYKNENISSFHTPGHKCNKKFLKYNLLSYDYTELAQTDNLFDPKGSILSAENRAAKVFKARRTLFSSGGCSLCIQAMLRLAFPSGGKIIASRFIHKSAVNAMSLLNITPVWVMPEKGNDSTFFEAILPEKVKELLETNKDVKAVYITGPDYFGTISDVKAISRICKVYRVPLLVDNAHGTHLGLLSENLHPLNFGADMVADSAHKTLPVLTGGAFLHINDQKYVEKAKTAMGLFASTSPSYPIMASLDLCCNWINKYGKKAFQSLEESVTEIKNIAETQGLIVQKGNLVDPTRLSFNTSKLGISGEALAEHFRKFKVEPEFSLGNFLVLIPTPFNTKKDFSRLKKAVLSISAIKGSSNLNDEKFDYLKNLELPQCGLSLREALLAESETLEVKNALGRISKSMICPCPPGIPIVLPGEVVTQGVVENLLNYGIFSLDVIK